MDFSQLMANASNPKILGGHLGASLSGFGQSLMPSYMQKAYSTGAGAGQADLYRAGRFSDMLHEFSTPDDAELDKGANEARTIREALRGMSKTPNMRGR